MLKQRNVKRCVFALLCACSLSVAPAADWPQFRGPDANGKSAETGLLQAWPEAGPEVLWRVPLGEGFSAMSIVGDRLYTLFAAGKNEFVAGFDAATGQEIWRTRIGATWTDRFGNGPRSTPTVDGEVVYGLSARGNLAALNTQDGSVVWQRDLKADFGARAPQWGVSTSPLLLGDLLLVDVGGKAGNARIAFDKATGEVRWKTGTGAAGYAAPVAMTIAKVPQVLFFTADGLIALKPKTGDELWRHAWKTSYDVNAATPIFIAPDKVFVSSGYDVGAALLQVRSSAAGWGTQTVWQSRGMKNQFSSSVLHKGHLYGFDDKTLKCIDAATGELRWRKREFGHGSLILADGSLIVLGDKGTLALVQAQSEAYVENGRVQVFEGKTWTMPIVSGGRLFLRDEHELVAMKIIEDTGAKPANRQ